MPNNQRNLIVIITALETILIFIMGVFASRLSSIINISSSSLIIFILIGLIALSLVTYLKVTFDPIKAQEKNRPSPSISGEVWGYDSITPQEKSPSIFGEMWGYIVFVLLGLPLTALGIWMIVVVDEGLFTKAILIGFIIGSGQMSYEGIMNIYYILSIRNINKYKHPKSHK